MVAASESPITMRAFLGWLGEAVAGDRCIYHQGHLGIDRMPKLSRLAESVREELSRVADAALTAANAGEILLAQRRIGEGRVAYLAIKTSPPTPNRRSRR